VTVRKSAIFATAAVLAAVVLFLTGPPAPQATSGSLPDPSGTLTRRGAFHVHTTRSDGALDKRQIASAAARAGLDFAIFTDHGDGTREPDPPEIIDGVLCIDAVEISTNGGHYLALGMSAAPYPLGGEADAVVEDVRRLGGFGVAAHPGSARQELAWTEWEAPIDGLEWLNADSEWRDESRPRLARAFLDYLWRPTGALMSLLDRPVSVMRTWDALSAARPVVGLAGHDAHGGIGAESGGAGGRRWHIPSYESSFRTFSLNVIVPQATAGSDPRAQADAVVAAIRRGALYTALDSLAAPAALDFRAVAGGKTATAGESLPWSSPPTSAMFSVRSVSPANGRIVLLRNGDVVAEANGGALEYASQAPGAYRVEVHASRAPGEPAVPWIVSNPIYRLAQEPGGIDVAKAAPVHDVRFDSRDWHIEHSDQSNGAHRYLPPPGDFGFGALEFRYQLAQHGTSPFVALAGDLASVPDAADTIVVGGRAARPTRVSVQLRFGKDGNARWRRSIYLDQNEREIVIPLGRLKPAEPGGTRPALSRATSLLFVVDLVNASPGATGTLTLTKLMFGTAVRAGDQVRTVK
jgi:hypothetical protein